MRRRVVKSELQAKKQSKKRQRGVAPQHPDVATASVAAAGAGAGDEQPQEAQQIDSPWARDIEALDAQVAAMQLELKRLDWDIWSIQVRAACKSFVSSNKGGGGGVGQKVWQVRRVP